MKAAAVLPNKKESLKLIDMSEPKLGKGEVLVHVFQVGLDGTDNEIAGGKYGKAPKDEKRLVIGHESLGVVEKTGRNARGMNEGDLVVATVRRPDGCINCRKGEIDMCLGGNYTERGINGAHGFLSEYYAEKPEFLVKVPKSMRKYAVLLEPLSVAEKAVRMAYSVQERMVWKPKLAIVTGTGTLGLLCAFLLRLKGVGVASVDRSDGKRKEEIFRRTGITHFNSRKINLHDMPKIMGRQADIIIEATGSSSVAMHAMMVGGRNGVVVLTSITGGSKKITLCSDCLNNGLVLENKAVVGTVNANISDFRQGIKDMKKVEKMWPGLLESMITAKFRFPEVKKALSALDDNIKVVVEIE